jgi:hypothetical protein
MSVASSARLSILADAERMLQPIGETGWTRQRIVDVVSTNGRLAMPWDARKRSLRKVLLELCKARILSHVSNAKKCSFYVFHPEYKRETWLTRAS